jgi:hypothetical protein
MRALALAAILLAAAPGAATAGNGLPAGTYAASLSGKSPAFLNGAWRLTFAPGGRYTTEHPPGQVAARGRLVLSGGTVTFGKETGPVACTTAGRYRWTYAAGRLRFAAISDPCGGREIVLTARPFRLVGG